MKMEESKIISRIAYLMAEAERFDRIKCPRCAAHRRREAEKLRKKLKPNEQ